MTTFENINSRNDIDEIIQKASSDDGESLDFELKGSQGELKFTKDFKKILAKEICAFANTYGGVLCFHFGGDTDILPFPTTVANTNFNSLEGWLRDCLEPKSLGMNLKIVDDIYIINIPESKTKPHRTNGTKEYYYRHSTISQKMPEIMISSMYRSQDFLNFSASVSLSKMNSQLAIHVYVNNHSNLSGSKPKIQIQLYSNIGCQIEYGNNSYFDRHSKDSFKSSAMIHSLKIPACGMISTNSDFAELILYPKDNISLTNFSKPDERIKKLHFILVRMDCMFKESIRQTEYKIIEFDGFDKPKEIMNSKDNSEAEIFIKFQQLLKIKTR